MNTFLRLLVVAGFALTAACDGAGPQDAGHNGHDAEMAEVKGPNGGRLLVDGDFALELALVEAGAPPEYRVWVTSDDQAVPPAEVEVTVTLTRLGGVQEVIGFAPQGDYLRGDTVVYEPHSFVIDAVASYQGKTHRWEYDSFEGRTRITPDRANDFGIETDVAGPATIRESLRVYGNVVADPERQSHVMSRFEGVIKAVRVSIGDRVQRGQTLAVVESNDTLRNFNVTAPIDGMIVQRHANSGEQTANQLLFTIMDTGAVWAELAVFPRDLSRVKVGQTVAVHATEGEAARTGQIALLNTVAESNQAVMARVRLDNADGGLVPGMYLTGEIEIARRDVPLAVRRNAVQSFRDTPAVYILVGDDYEARMIEPGRQDDDWVEVLAGIEAGARYVTTNSYVVKADIEKSGAAHDH